MKKLTALLLKEQTINFFVTFFAFFTIIFSIDFIDKIDDLIKIKAHSAEIILFFIYRIPFLISQITFYAIILSTMITINLLSQRNEIVAFLSHGITVRRIFVLMFVFVLPFNIMIFIADSFISPYFLLRSEKILRKNDADFLSNISDITLKTEKGFIFIDTLLPEEKTLINTYIINLDEERKKIDDVYYAPLITKLDKGWQAQQGKHISVKDNTVTGMKNFDFPDIKILRHIGSVTYQPEWLSLKDLHRIISLGNRSGMNTINHVYLLAKKIVRFITSFLLVYIVFPLGFQFGRNKKNVEVIFIGLLVLVVFAIAEVFIFKIAKGSNLPPLYPSVVLSLLLVLGGWVIWKKIFFWRSA